MIINVKEQIWLPNENICNCHLIDISNLYKDTRVYNFKNYWCK